jgi:hypothetical protein
MVEQRSQRDLASCKMILQFAVDQRLLSDQITVTAKSLIRLSTPTDNGAPSDQERPPRWKKHPAEE